jgi:alanine racemase
MTAAELQVDLDAFSANVARMSDVASPATVMLVVKDDAYGHGLATIVRRAWADGVRWFGAFDAGTGLAVRDELGPDARIFVWIAATADDTAAAVSAKLDIGIGDALLLEDVAAAAEAADAIARVHVKIDTGLHRNGVRPESWSTFVARARELEVAGAIDVVGVWSHIAEASDAEDDAARAVFESAIRSAEEAGLTPSLRHLAASAASFVRPEFRYDLVRVGAFAYGISPAYGPTAVQLGIRPVATLRATVTGIERDGVQIGVGALDGLPSTVAGRIDVGTPAGARALRELAEYRGLIESWPGAAVGQTVTIYGPPDTAPRTVTEVAESLGTIGEEIAVRVGPGVVRRYGD